MPMSKAIERTKRIGQCLLLGALFATVALPAYSQENSKPASDGKAAAAAARSPQSSPEGAAALTIGKGDLISVAVEGAPDFSKEVRVNPRGDVSLPMVGAVPVAGLTVEQAQEAVARRLAAGGYFNNPQVTIFEKEYATQGISVLGEVQKPGIYPLFGPHSVLDAISAAGGTTPKAGNKILLTRRGQPDKVETVPLDFKKEQMGKSNVEVHPGDTVVVSKAGIVYVVGDVRQPSGFVMENAH